MPITHAEKNLFEGKNLSTPETYGWNFREKNKEKIDKLVDEIAALSHEWVPTYGNTPLNRSELSKITKFEQGFLLKALPLVNEDLKQYGWVADHSSDREYNYLKLRRVATSRCD